ncbi:MAG: DUF1818 family protein [Microcystaceae cyanobacterium]
MMDTLPSQRRLREGQGWRLGFDPHREIYQGLVGGDSWAMELTASEFQDFCRLVQQLDETLRAIADELMDEEKITCAVESERVWLEAEGYSDRFTLHLIVYQGRGCEGHWSAEATQALIEAIRHFAVF